MGFKPVKFAMGLIYKLVPPARPYIEGIKAADKALDKAADVERKRRAALVDGIRGSSRIVVIVLLCAAAGGCETVKNLRREGYEVSHWQAFRLNVMDATIGADDAVDSVVDYEIGGGKK